MKLIYDMRHLGAQMHGMARYGLELLKAMLELEEDLAVGVLIRRPQDGGLLPRDRRLVNLACDLAPYGIKSQLLLPRLLDALRPQVYHCPFYAPPASFKGPMVFTVHDLIHLRFPRHYSLKHRVFYRWRVAPALKRARAVFTVSEHSKRDLVAMLGADPNKVVITPNGVGPEFSPLPAEQREQAARELGLPFPYLLGVGNPKPHKNLGALVEAHRLLLEKATAGEGSLPPLVLVGVAAADVPAPVPGQEIIFRDYLGDRDLAHAYGAAAVVVVPSLYEGFGLPALEALACGAPLVSSNRASLPEVVGGAGLLCDPEPAALAREIARLLADAELARRLRRRGPGQAARFTWRESARRTLAVYQEILSGRR